MAFETILVWLVVGLAAGWLASAVVGGGLGLVGDIIVGVLGAFVGSFILQQLHVRVPVGGLLGSVLVAFVGAVVLLLVLRVFKRGRRSRR